MRIPFLCVRVVPLNAIFAIPEAGLLVILSIVIDFFFRFGAERRLWQTSIMGTSCVSYTKIYIFLLETIVLPMVDDLFCRAYYPCNL